MAENNLLGRTVAGYRLLKHVGEGGTASVYRAEHPEHGTVAVKILRARLTQDAVAVKRFLREAEYGTRVNHPNIARTWDFGQADDLYYLAMEWVEGEALERFITRSGRLAPDLVAVIVEQIGAALAAAHAQGIIHRDLKPANIMYSPETRRAVLLDFGIARDADLKPEERLTRTGFFVGTLQYVAPEALSGELVDEQADVYSLATIAYHLLTGLLPYAGRSPRELFQQLLTQPPLPVNDAVRGVRFPDAVSSAVMAGLEREPAKRPRGVAEFTARLCAALRAPEERKGGLLRSLFGR